MAKIADEPIRIRRLNTLRLTHAAACSGSAGQGAFLPCHCINADAPRRTPETMNSGPLLADSHIIPGTAAVRPAITAPAPMVINSAGSAQQNSVEVLANNESVGPISDLRSMGFIRRVPHPLAEWPRFGNPLFSQGFRFAY